MAGDVGIEPTSSASKTDLPAWVSPITMAVGKRIELFINAGQSRAEGPPSTPHKTGAGRRDRTDVGALQGHRPATERDRRSCPFLPERKRGRNTLTPLGAQTQPQMFLASTAASGSLQQAQQPHSPTPCRELLSPHKEPRCPQPVPRRDAFGKTSAAAYLQLTDQPVNELDLVHHEPVEDEEASELDLPWRQALTREDAMQSVHLICPPQVGARSGIEPWFPCPQHGVLPLN